MDCKEIDNPPLLINLFREGIKREIDRVYDCFDKHYYSQFIRMVYTNLARKHRFLQGDSDNYGREAFHDALLSFQEKISSKGFVEGTAKIKTYFFTFCLFKLKRIITNHIRGNEQIPLTGKDPFEMDIPAIAEEDLYDDRQLLLQKAMGMLDEKRRQYIILRKMYNLKNEEIAAKMGIEPGSVNNEVYKSVIKLKEIIETLSGKK